MKTRVLSLVSLLMVAVMLVAACGPSPAAPSPAPSPKPTPAPAPTPTPTPTPAPAPTPSAAPVEKPKYGGTINMLQGADITVFDPALGNAATFPLTNEHFTEGDWSKGSAGTGQTKFFYAVTPQDYVIGHIAEEWKIPGIGVFEYKIRRGVRYALNSQSEASRLVNGREFTTDDAIFSVQRLATAPRSGMRLGAPEMARNLTVEKTGPWDIRIKTPVDPWWGYIALFSGWAFTLQTPEVVQKYGDMNDWRNSVGTGPYMLTDFVPGSVATLQKNPNYWQKNPVGPGKGDQLPYIDTVKLLIITDISTRQAALRTARLDWASGIEPEDAKSLMQTAPTLKWNKRIGGSQASVVIGMRTDKTELPFSKLKVRQALMLATDFSSLKNDLYGGDAQLPAWPFADTEDVADAYLPLDKQSAAVKELYSYNPTKAKQLLAEAGYPNGFKTKVITQSISTWMDPMSAIKSMWSKIGVDVEIQPREASVYTSISNARAYEEMIMKGAVGGLANVATMSSIRGETHWNVSFLTDPKIEAVFQEMQKNVIINMPKVFQLYRDFLPYLLEQAYTIPLPLPYNYTFWHPWIKNYDGQTSIRFTGGNNWVKFVWIDQDLKEKTTGRR